MNLLRPITIESAGNERNNDVFHHYKTLKCKSGGKILSNYVCLISGDKVGELIHQITHCYHTYTLLQNKRGKWFSPPPPTVHLRTDDVTWTYYTSF